MKEEEYEPYGKEWKKSLMKFTKSQLIDYYKERCLTVNQLLEALIKIEAQLINGCENDADTDEVRAGLVRLGVYAAIEKATS